MLYIVLLLVVGSLGLLLTALNTGNTTWAWVSVGVSVAAALLLLFEWAGWRLSQDAARKTTTEAEGETAEAAVDGTTRAQSAVAGPDESCPGRHTVSAAVTATASQPRHSLDRQPPLDPGTEPTEEDTDAADALRISELSDEVLVIDERPRYHLTGCAWIGDRATLPLAASEARELGFTPCGLCHPDAALIRRHHSAPS